ncbi:MAG TPA: hypothetical protein VGS19_16465 [Streptosporangiaceae bacterium]|nr:hypothetical protein [Streptosporangiaceae bacterium]
MPTSTESGAPEPVTPGAASPDAAAPKDAGPSIPGPEKDAVSAARVVGPSPQRNWFATAALALGAAGVTLVTILPGLVFAVAGLRRAAATGSGQVRSWAGVALALCWAAVGAYVVPHLVAASDPGCRAYKGTALTAYNQVISDFGGDHPAAVDQDLSRAIATLAQAASMSRDATTSHDLHRLTAQLKTIRADIRSGTVVSGSMLGALNRDAARADSDCGTLQV